MTCNTCYREISGNNYVIVSGAKVCDDCGDRLFNQDFKEYRKLQKGMFANQRLAQLLNEEAEV